MTRLATWIVIALTCGTATIEAASFHVLDYFQIFHKDNYSAWLGQARAVGAYSHPKKGRASGVFVSPHYFLTTYEAVEQIGCENAVIQTGLIAENPTKRWEEFFSTNCLEIAAQDAKLKLALVQVDKAAPYPLVVDRNSFSHKSETFRVMGYVGNSYMAVSDHCALTTRNLTGKCTATTCCGRSGTCQADDTIWAADCFTEAGMNGAAAVVEHRGTVSILGLNHARLQAGTYNNASGQPVIIGGGWRPPAVFASTYDFPNKMPDAWKLIEEDWQESEQRRSK